MASLALGVAGAAIGNAILPGIGGAVGWALGSALGNALFPQQQQVQRLHDLHLQGSSYGVFLKIVYGKVRIAGTCIWETDLQEHTSGGKGGKGSGGQASYNASFDVAICESQIAKLWRMWAAGRLNYDVGQPAGNTVPFTFYDGNDTQLPDPTEEAKDGAGNVPAYRGITRVVFNSWDLTKFGNTLPQLSFEVSTKGPVSGLITRAAEYHAEPYDATTIDRWAFRWTEGPLGTQFPVITSWDVTGDDIRVLVMNTTTVYTYGNPDLVNHIVDVSASPGDDFGLHSSLGLGNVYWPAGPFVYADNHVEQIYQLNVGNAVGTGADYAAVGSIGAVIGPPPDEVPTAGKNFAFSAGIGSSELVWATVLSQDGKHCFIFTSPAGGTAATKWYDIVDGAIARNGTVSGAAALGVGRTGQIYGGNLYTSAMFENNATWCWSFSSNIGSGGQATIYKITGSVFALDSTGGACNSLDPGYDRPALIPSHSASFAASIYVPQDGYCGVVVGVSLVLFTRLATTAATYLSEVVADLCDRAGLSGGQYDVSQLTAIVVDGYVIEQQMTCRAAIEALMPIYFFDAVERDGVIVFVVRGGSSVVTFLDDDLAAHEDNNSLPALLSCVHTPDADLPSSLSLAYLNKDADYQINTQVSQRMIGGSRDVRTVSVSIALSDAHAKKIVDSWLYNTWSERDNYKWFSSRKYAPYEPTDVCTVGGKVLRITKKTEGATGVIQWEGVPSRGANFNQVGMGGSGPNPGQTLPVSQSSQLVLLDLPLLNDNDSPNGIYAAMAGQINSKSPGAALLKSLDGVTYKQIGTGLSDTIGAATTQLGNYTGPNVIDIGNVVRVTLGLGGGTLVSTTYAGILNGSNEGVLGSEIFQWMTATLISPGVYDLSNLLRGRRGTEWAQSSHVVGDVFVAFDPTLPNPPAVFSEIGTTEYYKAVTFGKTLASATAKTFANTGQALKPYSPTYLGGGCDSVGNVTLNWLRRTRSGGGGKMVGPKPLSETAESYVVQIWDASYTLCARIIKITAQTATYTAAMQVTDFGSLQQTIFWTVGQVGAVSIGASAKGTAPSTGGSNTNPLVPIVPFSFNPIITPPANPAPGPDGVLTWPSYSVTIPMQIGQRKVYSFTTGATIPLTGTIAVAEAASNNTMRRCFIATDSGGLSVVPRSLSYGNTATSFLGTTSGGAILAAATTYYYIFDFVQADGTLSGIPGTDARTILSLGNVT